MKGQQDRIRLERRRDALLEALRGLGNLMRGSVVEMGVRCGRVGCECERGEKHRKLHLSVNLGGRTRGCYLGRERAAAAAQWVAEYQRARQIINELTAVNLELLRGEHAGGRATRPRPRGKK